MLLPDQTYEQCQLAPLVALKRILDDTESKPQIEIEYNSEKYALVVNRNNDDIDAEDGNGASFDCVDDEREATATHHIANAIVDDNACRMTDNLVDRKKSDSCNELAKVPASNGQIDVAEKGGFDDRCTRSNTPESYDQTSDFFNNVPDFMGEPLGPFSIPHVKNSQQTSADLMRECELFLYRHRMRPDFFCRYRKAVEYVFKFLLCLSIPCYLILLCWQADNSSVELLSIYMT